MTSKIFALKHSLEYGLQEEVEQWAETLMKEHPEMTEEEAYYSALFTYGVR